MANHGYVTTRKRLNGDKLAGMLAEINRDRFRGSLVIQREDDSFSVQYEEDGPARCLWLASRRKIEFRHGPDPLLWWVEAVVMNDLALKVGGKISDDGVDQQWEGEEGKYPTFVAWQQGLYGQKNLASKCFAYSEFLCIRSGVENEEFKKCLGKMPEPEGWAEHAALFAIDHLHRRLMTPKAGRNEAESKDA